MSIVPPTPPALSRDLDTPASALAIGAHPDDIEFQAGATLAKWASGGCVVHHLICTDGSKGTWDPSADQAELVALRRSEQRAAARTLGATGELVFLGWPDGELDPGVRQRSEIAGWIRRLRPQVVLGHDPWKRYRLHPDHRAAGLLAVEGVVAARDPFFFREQGIDHHRPDLLLLFEADRIDHLESSGDHGDTKVDALLEHASQFLTTMEIDDPTDDDQLAAFRRRELGALAAVGAAFDSAPAEAFARIDTT